MGMQTTVIDLPPMAMPPAFTEFWSRLRQLEADGVDCTVTFTSRVEDF